MATTPSKTFSAPNAGSDTVYFAAHPRYDALRVEFNSADSGSTSADVEVKVDSNDEVDEVQSNGYGSMDAVVYSDVGIDPSSGDPHTGTTAVGRVVAVQVSDTDGANNGSADGTVYLHNADDPAQNAEAFANR